VLSTVHDLILGRLAARQLSSMYVFEPQSARTLNFLCPQTEKDDLLKDARSHQFPTRGNAVLERPAAHYPHEGHGDRNEIGVWNSS
jgi:hypothetical protein